MSINLTGRLALAATALVWAGVTHPALAADMPAPAPVYRAPPPVIVPVTSWAGFYVGANGGGIWRQANSVTTVATTGAFVTAGNGNRTDFEAGGQIGYNFMYSPNLLIGVEVDSQYTGLRDTVVSVDGSNQHDSKFDYFGTARARVGFVSSNWLLYGTGGFAWGHGEIKRTQLTGTLNAATPGTVEVVDNTRTGWAAGAGVEVIFWQRWTGRLEYLYLDLQHERSVFPLANRAQDVEFTAHVFRAGVNYLFNGPITARY